MDNIHADSLQVPPVLTQPLEHHLSANRRWQGIPGIASTAGGRLFAIWYSGGVTEGEENFTLVVQSDDLGQSWSEPVLVIDPPGRVRAYDPVVWTDPQGRLWVFWAQSLAWWNGRSGTWAIRCDAPDAETLNWSEPRRVAEGIMMNKPTVLANGTWLLPTAIWDREPKLPELKELRLSNVTASTDNGETLTHRGGADIRNRAFDEHMVLERNDGSLWMLVRAFYGIGQSTSTDEGRTWARGTSTNIPGPDSRFHLKRLPSGRILLVNHFQFTGRSHMTALLSEDEGQTWPYHLLLDERDKVSYPDADVLPDGRIGIIYDRQRYDDREILMAIVDEADIVAGKVSKRTQLKMLVNQATGPSPR